MAELVIDASVLVKWFVKEADSDKALALRDRHVNGEVQLAAPSLITYETLNALKYTGLFSTKQLKEIAVTIQNYGLSLHALVGKTADFVLDAAERNTITVYDAAYLGLATQLEAEFITADKALLGKLTKDYARMATTL